MTWARPAAVVAILLAGCGGEPDGGGGTPAATADRAACRPLAGAGGLFTGGRAQTCPVQAGGERRDYVLYEPRGLGRAPLVVVLHGVGGPLATPLATAEASRFDRLADREGVAVAFPDGRGTWNDAEDPAAPDDVAFVDALLDDVAVRRPVDRRRVFLAGWSGGGFMVHRLACRLAGRVAAIGVLHAPLRGPCDPARPVSVLQLAGGADDVIPPAGGTTPDGTRTPPVAAATARWRRLDGCGAGCRAGTAVRLVRVPRAGHAWWGPDQPPPDDAIDATAELWRFFAAHPAR